MRSSQKFNFRKESTPSLGAKTAHAGPRGFSTWEFCYDQSFPDGDDATRCEPAPSPRHPRFQIFWVRQGQARLRLDLESLEVRGPCLVVVGPGEVPTWEQPWELAGTVVTVDAAFISPPNFGLGFDSVARFLETAARRSLALNPAENALTGNFFSQIRQLGDAPHCGGPEVLKALLLVLFGGLSRSPPAPRLDGPSAPPSRMTRDFKSALRSECPRLTTVTEYAGFLKVSRLLLHQSVLRDTGAAPAT